MTSHFHRDDTSSQTPTTPTQKQTREARMILKGHEDWVRGVAVIPGARLLVTCSDDKSLRMWDLDKAHQVMEPLWGHDDYVLTVAASHDGRWIASGGWGGNILVWKVSTKNESISFKGHKSAIGSIVFASNSGRFASASADKTVCVWRRDTGKIVLGPLYVGSAALSVSYSPDGRRLAAGTDEHIIVWNAASGKELLKIEQRALEVAFTPDGLHLVSGNQKDIRISDAATGDIIKQFDAHAEPFQSLAIAPDGSKFATTSSDKTTRFFDLTTFELIDESLEHPDIVWCVAFSEDSQLIVTGCEDRLARIWSVPQSKSEKEGRERLPRPNRAGLPHRFFDDVRVETTYPPCRPNRSAHGSLQHPTGHSRIKDLIHRLPFRRLSPQAQPEVEHSWHLRVTQLPQQLLPTRRSRSGQEPPIVDVAVGRKFTRLAIAHPPEYRKVDDTRRPPREQPVVSQDMAENDPSSESAETDSLPDIHWFKAFICFYSCWSHGRLRMPPRWRLELVDQPH
ncbi:WD40-repeat-containing domain protein [Suillus paluster]|uniref:WD40-repeat-containing domain protein n=1 Tax=Suillus paluster TaxID=48578 RepID=UPI001B875859|nr:WD40-repeat-containing domain protein [Suillus paluster]KAG1727265.1 WD40-repeat-containing domain protein [Suillus paluster]